MATWSLCIYIGLFLYDFDVNSQTQSIDGSIKSFLTDKNFKEVKRVIHELATKQDLDVIKDEDRRSVTPIQSINNTGNKPSGQQEHISMDRKGKTIIRTESGVVKSTKSSMEDNWLPVPRKGVKFDDKQVDDIAKHLDKHIHQILRSSPQQKGNKTHHSTLEKLKRKTQEKFKDLTEDAAFWAGMVVGGSTTLILVFIMLLMRMIIQKFRSKKTTVRDLNVNSFCDYDDMDPVYVRLSELHEPRTKQPHVVSVRDRSNNFSIDTSSSDSSTEEEIFNASSPFIDHVVKSYHGNRATNFNMTSTPVKKSPDMKNAASQMTPSKRNLFGHHASSPQSPLASVPPVFASPIKVQHNS